ncbi:MAG: hypothetical protein IKO72_00610 [Kiritimatiellae bacterium]|nr:hypothetical protein [Kiritimatiellia bacterium]
MTISPLSRGIRQTNKRKKEQTMHTDEIIFFAWLAAWLPIAIAYFISEAK